MIFEMPQKEHEELKEKIYGARNLSTFSTMLVFFFAGLGFFLAGLSSYLNKSLIFFADTSEIHFIPQGITMLFYGTLAISFGFYNLFILFFNVGSGYNEFSKKESLIKIVRLGFPGKNRNLFLNYEFKNVKKLKLLIKQGINPRCTIFLVLQDGREIPLFPAEVLLSPLETEKKAIVWSTFLNVPLESVPI